MSLIWRLREWLVVAIAGFVLFVGLLWAQQPSSRPGLGFDPLVGTWNFNGAGFQGTVSFNAGGTSVEFDNSGRSPQVTPNGIAEDTISLGPWERTGTSTYLWKTQNFAFPNGNVVVARPVPR